MSLSNLVKRVDLRRVKAALAWMPPARQAHAGPRAVPSARPAPFLRAAGLALLAMALGGVLLWSAPAQAQTVTVVIKNTGQSSDTVGHSIHGSNSQRAQQFTTGSNSAGYTLSSIGIGFTSIADTATAGANLTVTLNEVSSDSNPSASAECTLTDPATFTANAVNTFTAPATCPMLVASTSYFVVVNHSGSATDAIQLDSTSSGNEDTGGADGWSIGNTRRWYSSSWNSSTSAHLIEVKATATIVSAPVLIKNTGQTDSGDYGLGVGGNSKRAQAFTTGANAAGYTLSSIGFSFGSITSISTAGADLAVTLNGVDSSGNPDAALCTLTDPGTFSGSGVQIFDAPATDPCETLEANKTYFAVVQRVANTATSMMSLDVTADDADDAGGADGWSIGDDSYVVVTIGTAWVKNANFNHQMAVRGYANNNPATGAPSISGVLEENEVLTADTAGIADIDDLGTFSYQWLAGGTAISGATSSTYTLTATEVGNAISLTVTFTDDAGNSESLTSAATHNVVASGATRKLLWVGTLTPADVGNGEIGFGDTTVGSLSPSSFIDGSTTYAFEAIEFGTAFGLAIVVKPGSGAVEQVKWIFDAGGEFALFDATHIVRDANVRSEWRPIQGNPNWSIGTETVVYLLEDLNNRATGAPSISGVLQQDEELTADTAGIADADGVGTLSYQWLAGGTAISGATSSTYTLQSTEVGDAISLTVTFTDVEGYSESLTSAETHDVVATGATRKLLWLGTLTPGDRGFGAIGVNTSGNEDALSPSSFTYGSVTYEIDIIDFGPVPHTGLSFIMSPVPGADEEEAWIVDTGREWLVSDDDISINKAGGQMFLLWPAVEGDVDWTIGEETVVYLLEVVNYPPVFTDTAPTARSVDENTASATDIGAAVAATDPDADTLVYGLTGTDASSFSIDSTSGQLKTSASLDFETDSSYSVSVTVHDGKDAIGGDDTTVDATIAVTISVNNVDDAGTVTLPSTFTGGTAATASVTDPDGTVSSPSWRWARGTTATGSFSNIGGATSATYTPVAADVGEYLRAAVTYTDPQGSGKTARAVSSGTVVASNAEPSFSTTTATRTLPENSGAGVDVTGGTVTATDGDSDTLTYWLTGTDAARFEIDSDGQIKVKTGSMHTFNFEASKNSYSVTVNVRDSKDAAGNADTVTDDTIAVTIDLTNVNEAPVITTTATTVEINENSTGVLTVTASDVDASTTLNWSVEAADDGGKFEINISTGAFTTLSFKNAPDFEMPDQAGSTDNQYRVTVKVEDDASPASSDTHMVTVTVTNVNEAPEITTTATTHTDFDVDENTATSAVIKTYMAMDVDASSTLTWSLEGNDAGDFTITKNADGDGDLKFRNAPNFEMPADADTMNDYDIRVKVKDNGIPGNRGSSNQLDDTVSVEVNVLDVNEIPVISGDNSPEFAEIEFDATSPVLTIDTYAAIDDEGDSVTWAVSGTDAGHFSINSTSGELSFSIRPDYENPANMASNNMYEIVLEAEDDNAQGGKTGTKTGTLAVIVTVTNVDETPEITTTAASHTAPSFMEIEYDAPSADLNVVVYAAWDEEDGTTGITWSLSGTDAGDFTISTDTDTGMGTLTFRNRPNFEDAEDGDTYNDYEITVRARDTTSPLKTRELAVVVTVTDVNERPDIDEDTVPSYAEIEYDFTGTPPDVHTFTATDYDAGDTFAWSLLGTDAAYLEIDATTGVLTFAQDDSFGRGPLPNSEYPRDDGSNNTYSITVWATDDDASDQKFTDYAVVVTVTDVNEAPEFTGTPETAITLNEHDANDNYVVMNLEDYAAYDEEGGVTWSLTGTDRGDFAINADGVLTFAETPNFEAPEDSGGNNVYEFRVVATDVASGSSRRNVGSDVTVTVGDVEEAGTLTVDSLSPVAERTLTFTLTDPDGRIDTSNIIWDIQSMATGGSWETVSGVLDPASTTFPWTVDEDETGKRLRAVVTYTDRRGSGKTAQSEETAEVTANPIVNAPPRFRGISIWSVEEGPAGKAVGDPISGTDRDRDSLTFGIQSGVDSAFFEIDPSSGQVSLAQALDFETASSVYLSFTLTLHDGRDADGNVEDTPVVDVTRSALVTILDVEEAGVVTLSAVEPETDVQLTATLEDGDGGVTGETWQWARSENGRTGWTNVSGATSSSYTPTVADEDFFLRATVTYTDRRGADKSAEGVTDGPVPSENRRPRFPSTETGERTVPENTRAGTNVGAPVAAEDPENDSLTYTLTGTDAAAFTIVTSTGQIRASDALDFETQPSYSVAVEVHDGRDGSGDTSTTIDDTQAVTITVENVEELGTVTLTTDTQTVQARVEVTAALQDEDGIIGTITWQWSRSPNGRTDWVNIAGATSATYTPTLEEDAGSYIRATASYTDGHGPNKTANTVSPRVGDPPPVNSAPLFLSTENGQREVEENSAEGSAVGTPVAATDLNAGDSAVNDPLAYSLSGTDAASFTIDSSTGQISVGAGAQLDYEGKRTHRFTVQVTDGRDRNGDDDMDAIDDTLTVTVTVTNVNEAPVVTGDETPSFQEDSNAAIATYTGTDPERGTLTWSVSGNDFWISSRGRLYFLTPPSFEGQTSYTVTVTATDGDETAPLSGSLAVTVTVTDAEEEGVVAITPTRGWVDAQTVFSADLADDDGGITGTTWQWARSSNGRSGWVDIPNATSSSYTVDAADANQYLRATASYEDRRGSNKTAEAVLSSPVGDARPTVNTAPAFTEDDDDTDTGRTATRRVSAGTAAGRNVGSPVRATDTDQGDVLTYSLSGTDANAFDIDPATGQVRTKDVLDNTVKDTYEVTVSVHDGFDADYNPSDGSDDTIDVTITVTAAPTVVRRPPTTGGNGGSSGGGGGGGGAFTPIVPPPVFGEGFQTSRSVSEDAKPGDEIGEPVSARSVQGQTVTYSLSGIDAALFIIDEQTGQISIAEGAVFDFEGEQNRYQLTVVATNASGATASIRIIVTITNVALTGIAGNYDANGNELIDLEEVIAAVADYHAGSLTREEATAIVNLYYESVGGTS